MDRGYEAIDPQEDLICAVCRTLLHDPVQTTCDHHFCRHCLDSALQSANECPLCRAQCPGKMEASRLVKALLGKQAIRCTQGRCGAEMMREKWEQHARDCDHTPVPCPHSRFGCKQRLARRKLSSHSSVCDFRPKPLPRAVLNVKVDVDAANLSDEVIDVPLKHEGALHHRNAATFRLDGNDIHVLRPGVVSMSLSIVARARDGWTDAHERYHGIGIQVNGVLVAYSLFPRRVQRGDCVSATLTHHAEVAAGDVFAFRIGMASKRLIDDLQATDISIRWDTMD
eukprot:TRINITY_DN3194_c0_g2_i1.p1 TRINITY_DN3194_c0_g2~~TRINITY_DN3194_c0_g2_i1.p1  ORF type:complete len:283 (+),score=64.09 TRINITY_DN3194_c0_g2_i1:150-998(+)